MVYTYEKKRKKKAEKKTIRLTNLGQQIIITNYKLRSRQLTTWTIHKLIPIQWQLPRR